VLRTYTIATVNSDLSNRDVHSITLLHNTQHIFLAYKRE